MSNLYFSIKITNCLFTSHFYFSFLLDSPSLQFKKVISKDKFLYIKKFLIVLYEWIYVLYWSLYTSQKLPPSSIHSIFTWAHPLPGIWFSLGKMPLTLILSHLNSYHYSKHLGQHTWGLKCRTFTTVSEKSTWLTNVYLTEYWYLRVF